MNEKEYEAVLEMFASDGWKLFMKSVSDARASMTEQAPQVCETGDQWHLMRGQILQLGSIEGWETFVRLSNEDQDIEDVDDL